MILRNITVKRLRAIRQDKTVNFSPGLNIIKGSDNEAGKTSLRVAITKALFQDPTTSQKEIHALTSWGTDEPWEVALEFDSDSESYRISKSLKDGSCELTRSGSGERSLTSKKAIAASVSEITGCPSETFFESTACIGQDELIRLIPLSTTKNEEEKTLGTITRRLQAAISGAKETDVSAIISKLFAKIHRKNANGPYAKIQEISKSIEDLNRDKPGQEEKINSVMKNRRELDRVKKELAKINVNLPIKQQLVEKNAKIVELQETIKRDKSQYDIFERAKNYQSELDSLNDKLKKITCFTGAEKKIEQLDETKAKHDELERQSEDLQKDVKKLSRQNPALWMLILGGILIAMGIAGLFINKYLGIVAATGLPFLAYWAISQTVWKRQNKLIQGMTAQVEETSRQNDEVIKKLLKAFGFSDYGEYKRQLDDYEEKKKGKKELHDRLSGILGNKDWVEFEKENKDLAIKMTVNRDVIQQLIPFKMEPLELQKLEGEVSKLQVDKKSFEWEEGGIERFLKSTDADTNQLTGVEEELEGLKEEKDFWKRKQRVFKITHEVLEKAHKQTLSKAALVMESDLGEYISTITDGRYSKVKIDESDLSIETSSPEKEGWVDVLELSKATQDQFYICARFALVKLVTKGKAPPLLLDDPFVNFHRKRLDRMILLLQELAKENQILLFTCSDAYDNCGNVISL